MESRGVYMAADIPEAKRFGENLLAFNNRIGDVVNDWKRSVRSDDATLFPQFSQRIKEFQEFRRELVRRGIEIGPSAAREWGIMRPAVPSGPRSITISTHWELSTARDQIAFMLKSTAALLPPPGS
jgi:hypothetical protein